MPNYRKLAREGKPVPLTTLPKRQRQQVAIENAYKQLRRDNDHVLSAYPMVQRDPDGLLDAPFGAHLIHQGKLGSSTGVIGETILHNSDGTVVEAIPSLIVSYSDEHTSQIDREALHHLMPLIFERWHGGAPLYDGSSFVATLAQLKGKLWSLTFNNLENPEEHPLDAIPIMVPGVGYKGAAGINIVSMYQAAWEFEVPDETWADRWGQDIRPTEEGGYGGCLYRIVEGPLGRSGDTHSGKTLMWAWLPNCRFQRIHEPMLVSRHGVKPSKVKDRRPEKGEYK